MDRLPLEPPSASQAQVIVFPWARRAEARWGREGARVARWLDTCSALRPYLDAPLLDALMGLPDETRWQVLLLASDRLRGGDHPWYVASAIRTATGRRR